MFRSSEGHRLTGSHMLIPLDRLIYTCQTVYKGGYVSLDRGERHCSYQIRCRGRWHMQHVIR
jgi:hypothetical protein